MKMALRTVALMCLCAASAGATLKRTPSAPSLLPQNQYSCEGTFNNHPSGYQCIMNCNDNADIYCSSHCAGSKDYQGCYEGCYPVFAGPCKDDCYANCPF